jgi:hypothetical protein
VASREGFRPRVVNVRKGQPVRLLLSSADGEHCFALDAFRIEKRVVILGCGALRSAVTLHCMHRVGMNPPRCG